MNKIFLIAIDVFTKWHVCIVPNMLSEQTILVRKEIFSRFGVP